MVRPTPMAKSKRSGARGGASATSPAPRSMPSKGDSRASVERSDRMAQRRRANNLGTQFGERTMSRVQEVSFTRAQPMRANQALTVRYDDAAGLQARGIRLFAEPPRRPLLGSGGWRRDSQRGARRTRFAAPPP